MLLPRLQQTLAAAALISSALAFKDSTPFFLLSTHNLQDTSLQSSQVAIASDVDGRLLANLESCDSQIYVLLRQSGLRADDVRRMNLASRMGSKYKSVIDIPEIIGDMEIDTVASTLSAKCDLDTWSMAEYFAQSTPLSGRRPALIEIEGVADLGSSEPAGEAESAINHILAALVNHTSHTIILTAPQVMQALPVYDMDKESEAAYQNVLHTDLKRDLSERQSNRTSHGDPQAGLPLFERYQFLSPAIFMGLAVSLLLLVILYVGIKAIAGLEVSYAAFSKENGPQAQGKGKQQ